MAAMNLENRTPSFVSACSRIWESVPR